MSTESTQLANHFVTFERTYYNKQIKTNEMNTIQPIEKAANNTRILIAAMVENAKSGHPGGAMGAADFINVLYSEFLIYDPENPFWENRDRFFLDPGHMCPMLYSVLSFTDKFSMDDLKAFRSLRSNTPGHPEIDTKRGIECTSGTLGQGHAFAVGAAIAAKFLEHRLGERMDQTIYTFISDGGIQEEVSQGAGRIAGKLGLSNLVMFYDSNAIQASGPTSMTSDEDVAAKYKAWNWKVISINGNDIFEIRKALSKAKEEKERPTLIIGHTQMAKGAVTPEGKPLTENLYLTHGGPISSSGASYEKTIESLGGNPENPFIIFPEVKDLFTKREDQLRKIVAEKNSKKEVWTKEMPELACKMKQWFSGKIPPIDWSSIKQVSNKPTRIASGVVMDLFGRTVENVIAASADLGMSDQTGRILKYHKAFDKGDFSGAFIQVGVSELTMACLCIGIAIHGGVIPICGTFFAFSDYMKPAIRLAALMKLPVKFIWSHDSFRIGEDGATHQPIEQELQIRLMEKLKNHAGKNSMLVLRPADAEETTVSWKLAMENNDSPTGLILSRQSIPDLPAKISRHNEALQAEKGAYVVKEDVNYDVILLGSGSEVSLLVEVAEELKKENIKTRIVSVPSEGLFRGQSKEYQLSILPKGKKRFGLTSGLSATLESLVGEDGMVWGLDTFGLSAPYKVLEEEYGFTVDNISKQVKFFTNDIRAE